jgi:flagellar protein FliO/FliZ
LELIKTLLPPLLAVVFVIGLAYATTRFIGKRHGGGLSQKMGKNITVIERTALTRDTQLVIVKAGEKTLLLSVSAQGAKLIRELDPDTLVQNELAPPETDFLKALASAFSKRKDGTK